MPTGNMQPATAWSQFVADMRASFGYRLDETHMPSAFARRVAAERGAPVSAAAPKISIRLLARAANPFKTNPWTAGAVTEAAVARAFAARKFCRRSDIGDTPKRVDTHARRIAYLASRPDSWDPISIVCESPDASKISVTDGNHRLAAAIFLDLPTIRVSSLRLSERLRYPLGKSGMTRPATPAADIDAIISTAKLGRERRAAQEDTCAVFGAALYDLLQEIGVPCSLHTATDAHRWAQRWYHQVVRANGKYYDSRGEFSQDIWRTRLRIHPKVTVDITYTLDKRPDCYEDDLDGLHAFYLKALRRAWTKLQPVDAAPSKTTHARRAPATASDQVLPA